MAVTAGVIGRALKVTAVALLQMTSQCGRAADLNGTHDLEVGGRQGVSAAIVLPVLTKDIGQLWARLPFSCRPPMSERQHRRRLSVRESQKVQRAVRGVKPLLSDL